ncbi:MAG: TetR/AcrR family transcriptional regulator [Bacteroidota bacterium]
MRIQDETKKALVKEKALELLVEHGFEGFSMQKLAKEAGISPATLYIYYTDKDDLIRTLGIDLSTRFAENTLEGFDSKMPLREGLKKQWHNRSRYLLSHPVEANAWEVIRHSPVGLEVAKVVTTRIGPAMADFVHNAVANKELKEMPLEVYWSITYGPLYTLLKFHLDGRSFASTPFKFSEQVMNDTLELVLKALKP